MRAQGPTGCQLKQKMQKFLDEQNTTKNYEQETYIK